MREDNLVKDLERRESIRLDEALPVSFKFPDSDKEYQAFTKNVAKDGLCINAELPKSIVNKNLSLSVDIAEIKKRLDFQGQIVWSSDKNEQTIKSFGLRFVNSSIFSRDSIKDYIFKKLNVSLAAEYIKPVVLRDIYLELSEKERRSLNMLDTIRRRGPISKADIAKIINLNIGTISNYVEDYIKKQIIFDKGLDVSSGGRRPSLLELNEKFAYTIGVDIKEFINVCLIDAKGNILNKLKQEIKDGNKYEEVNTLISEVILTSKVDANLIRGIGLAKSSRVNSYNGLIGSIENKFKLPVFVIEESDVSVFAEYWTNYDFADLKNIIYLSLDDFTCGLIINRELYYFKDKNLMNINSSKDFILNNKDSDLKNKEVLLNLLFLKLINIIDLLNPDLIIIGGSVGNINELIGSLKDKIKNSIDAFKYVKIVASAFSDYTASIGAASLVAREVFIQS